ncbi:hypothetical protein Tco_0611595 [Tanacetum coccineum]
MEYLLVKYIRDPIIPLYKVSLTSLPASLRKIKSLLDAVRITAAHVFVNVDQLDLVLLAQNCSVEVNAASKNMFEVTTASEYQVNVAS